VLLSSIIATTFSEAGAYYGNFGYGAFGGAAMGYPYAYSLGYTYTAPAVYGYAAPVNAGYAAAAFTPTTVHSIAAPVISKADPVAEVHSEVHAEVPSVTSSQFHSQDEEGNYAFGYKNINGYRVESGNVLTGVSGSYSDGFRTYNYVADDYGFRHV
jgi:hypothetical protein